MKIQSRIRFTVAALIVSGVVLADPLTEDSCSILAGTPGEKPTLRAVPGMSVLDRDASQPFVLVGIDGVTISGVVCWRSEARLSQYDYVVPVAGFPLYIKTDQENEALNRTIALEKTNSGFRVRLLSR